VRDERSPEVNALQMSAKARQEIPEGSSGENLRAQRQS
jgi:hypothetical protein